MPNDRKNLLIRPFSPVDPSDYTLVATPESTGFEYLTLRIRKVTRGQHLTTETGACELGMVVLGCSTSARC